LYCFSACRLGKSFPTHVHDRDAASPNWGTASADGSTICGAVVSGAWALPANTPTDLFTDNRDKYEEAEPAVDYSASVLCAFGGYADVPDGGFDHCTGVRTPQTGRP
jgi:Glycosyl hydrolase family 9